MGFFQGRGTARGLIMMIVLMSLCVSKGVLATNYKVGDGSWTITTYDAWLAGKTFKVGDTVEFVYTSAHNVVEVSETEYGSCSPGTNSVKTDGDTTYTLTTNGTKYFICSVPTHCESGMKIAIPVEAAATTPPTTSPTPSTPTPSTSPTTPTPSTPTNTTTSTPPGSASSPLLLHSSLFLPTLLLSLGLSILFFKA